MNNILLDSTKSFSKEGTFKLELDTDTTINIENDNIKLYLITKNNIKIDFNDFPQPKTQMCRSCPGSLCGCWSGSCLVSCLGSRPGC